MFHLTSFCALNGEVAGIGQHKILLLAGMCFTISCCYDAVLLLHMNDIGCLGVGVVGFHS